MTQIKVTQEFEGGYYFVAFAEVEKVSDLLNEMASGDLVSLADIYHGVRYHDCDQTSCGCDSRYIGRDSRIRLGGSHRVQLNPWTGETLRVDTPILQKVSGFLRRLYSHRNPRTRARFDLAWEQEEVEAV